MTQTEQKTEENEQHANRMQVEASVLLSFVESISSCVSDDGSSGEAKVHWTDDGLETTAADPADVAMVVASLSTDATESYHADGDPTIGVDLGRLIDVIGLADADETLTVAFDAETHRLRIDAPGSEFDLATIEPASVRQEPDIPDLEFAVGVDVSASWLRRARDGCEMLGSTDSATVFEPDDDGLEIRAEGDVDEARFAKSRDELIDVEKLADVRSLYSTSYLEGLLDGLTGDVRVRIGGDELPMRIDSEEEFGNVAYVIAPRIENH